MQKKKYIQVFVNSLKLLLKEQPCISVRALACLVRLGERYDIKGDKEFFSEVLDIIRTNIDNDDFNLKILSSKHVFQFVFLDFDTFKKEVQDSIDFYVACAKEDGDAYPEVLDGDYELVFKFDVQSLLQFYQGIFSFSALQTITGINQKQLAHYAAGRSKPRPQQAQKISEGLHRLAEEMMTVTA